jgi:hypothetical protein
MTDELYKEYTKFNDKFDQYKDIIEDEVDRDLSLNNYAGSK